jgi:hypothetical protein
VILSCPENSQGKPSAIRMKLLFQYVYTDTVTNHISEEDMIMIKVIVIKFFSPLTSTQVVAHAPPVHDSTQIHQMMMAQRSTSLNISFPHIDLLHCQQNYTTHLHVG